MATFAVIKSGGKQYLVTENQEVIVPKIKGDDKNIEVETLFSFDGDNAKLNMKASPIKAELVEHIKGEKIRVAKFKAKVRYRKVRGFRPQLTKIKIGAL